MLIPIYLIFKNTFQRNASFWFEYVLIAFISLSFSPLILTSGLQKNAFAIPLMLFFIHYLLNFLKSKSIKYLLFSALFLILTGLTHFGVFAVSLCFLLISLVVFYRKKALLPILGILVAGVLLVYLFDPVRAERLLLIGTLIFERPAILHGFVSPLIMLNFLLSWFLIGLGIYFLIKMKNGTGAFTRQTIIVFMAIIFVLSFPLLGMEYAKRFLLLLFFLQGILLFVLSGFLSKKLWITISVVLMIITIASVSMMTMKMKSPSITEEAYLDLKNLETKFPEPENTLIIPRHGLEWWVAWQLHTKVGQEKSLTPETFDHYNKVISLVQLNGRIKVQAGKRSPFHEPYSPINRKPLYVSGYFKAVELQKGDLKYIVLRQNRSNMP
jgi:hypothetical protein